MAFSVLDTLNQNSKAGADETPKARFRTKDVSVFKMYRNDMNFYALNEIEGLAADIFMFGLKQNLEAVYDPCDKGEYRIVSGERRWMALKHLVSKGHKQFEFATCKITIPQNDDEEQIEIIVANSYREKTEAELVEEERRLKESLEKLRAAGKTVRGYDLSSGKLRTVIAAMLKKSETKIAQIESINNNLIPEFREEFRNERMTFSAAYELSSMSSDRQREALGKYIETGELKHKDIKEMKEVQETEEQIPGQMEVDTEGNIIDMSNEENVSESDTEEFTGMNTPEEYQDPHPEGIISICYSCQKYSKCNVMTGTCTTCDQYINKAQKTEEQRYSKEQDRIDRETAKKLREMEDEKKIKKLPSDRETNRQQVHQIKIAPSYYDDVASGRKPFELRKNDRNYKVEDILELVEFKEGKNTGRVIKKIITYLLEDYTGIEEGYCILGIKDVRQDDEGENIDE